MAHGGRRQSWLRHRSGSRVPTSPGRRGFPAQPSATSSTTRRTRRSRTGRAQRPGRRRPPRLRAVRGGPRAAQRPLRRGALPAPGLAARPGGRCADDQPVHRTRPTRHDVRAAPDHHRGRPTSEIWKAITPAAVLAFQEFSAEEIGGDARRRGRARGRAARPLRAAPAGARRAAATDRPAAGRAPGGRGHTRLGYAYPDDERLRIFAEPRLDGVRVACTALGLDAPAVRRCRWTPTPPPGPSRAGGRASVSAVCAYNDEVALAVLAGLRGMGLAAPATSRSSASTTSRGPPRRAAADHRDHRPGRGGRAPRRHDRRRHRRQAGAPPPGPDIVEVVRRGSA